METETIAASQKSRRTAHFAFCPDCWFRGQSWYDYGIAVEDLDAHREHCDSQSCRIEAI